MNVSLNGRSPAVLHLSVHPGPDGVHVALGGELDMATADDLVQACRSLPTPRTEVCLDLSGLDFLDAAGLCALLAVHAEVPRAGAGWSCRDHGRWLVSCWRSPGWKAY